VKRESPSNSCVVRVHDVCAATGGLEASPTLLQVRKGVGVGKYNETHVADRLAEQQMFCCVRSMAEGQGVVGDTWHGDKAEWEEEYPKQELLTRQ
jgi:hypothetical protein